MTPNFNHLKEIAKVNPKRFTITPETVSGSVVYTIRFEGTFVGDFKTKAEAEASIGIRFA